MNNSNNSNNSNNMNVLFYSQKCDTCRNLLILLKNENLLGYFKLTCVDDKLKQLPQNMIVPTMIVININKPLVAQETFEWVKQMKFIRQQQIMDINKKIIQQNLVNNDTIKKGPIGFDNEIMTGISDKFAFTKIDSPLPHSYFGVNEEDKNAIFTAPHDSVKISKGEQNKLIQELQSKRKDQDDGYTTIMKQQQLNAVMNTEHEKLNMDNLPQIYQQQSYQSHQSQQSQPQVSQPQISQQQLMQQQLMQQQMMQQQIMQQQMMQQQMMQQNNMRRT